jgi:hypothetical protein
MNEKVFTSKEEHLAWCVKKYNNKKNIAIEFGVFSGATLQIIRDNFSGDVYGFDSFDGLPETWRAGFEEGHFRTNIIPEINGAKLIIGLFQDTLLEFLKEIKNPISVIHMDADLYSSTIYCLNLVVPYLADKSIIIFDEWHNYDGCEEHEQRAFNEWLSSNPDITATRIGSVNANVHTQNNEQVSFCVEKNKNTSLSLGEI